MEDNRVFVCSLCGKEYVDVSARARCELACDEKQRQEAEFLKQKRLRKEREARKQVVVDRYNSFIDEWKQYQRDYQERLVFGVRGLIR